MTTGTPHQFVDFAKSPFQSWSRILLARKSVDGETFDEAFLQRMIHEAPAIVPVHEYFPGSVQVVSLGREIPVDVGGGKVRSLDNLLVTTDGRLVFIEAKLWRNPEALREVVAQALEYARALTSLKVSELEQAIRSCGKADRVLQDGESIEEYLARLNDKEPLDGYDPNTFGSQLERNLRTGEVLLLILGDGIHPSIERFVDWFERRASLPLSFGLVQIQVFQHPETGKYLAVPQTLLKTREVTRHVVIVDIKAPEGVTADVKVETGTAESGSPKVTSRPRATAEGEITWPEMLTRIRQTAPGMEAEVEEFASGLEALGLTPVPTKTAIAYALYAQDEKQPIRMVSVLADKVYAGWMALALKNVGLDTELAIRFREDLNRIAPFWREVGKPGAVEDKAGVGVPLTNLKSKLADLLAITAKHAKIIKEAGQLP